MAMPRAVPGFTFAIEPPYRFATQSDPFPYVIPVGPSPTGIVVVIVILPGSISESVPSRLFVTHTPDVVIATPSGLFPTRMELVEPLPAQRASGNHR